MIEKTRQRSVEATRNQGTPASGRTISVTPSEAEYWLHHLNQWLEHASGSCTDTLLILRNLIEDGFWLGRWKRDFASIELSTEDLPEIVAVLSAIDTDHLSTESHRALEQLLHCIAVPPTR